MVLEGVGVGASQGLCIVHTASVTQCVIDNQKVLWETDDLESASQNSI